MSSSMAAHAKQRHVPASSSTLASQHVSRWNASMHRPHATNGITSSPPICVARAAHSHSVHTPPSTSANVCSRLVHAVHCHQPLREPNFVQHSPRWNASRHRKHETNTGSWPPASASASASASVQAVHTAPRGGGAGAGGSGCACAGAGWSRYK